MSYTDQVNIARWLIENGADINHKNNNGRTSLMIVAGQGKQTFKYLSLYVFVRVSLSQICGCLLVPSECLYNCQRAEEMLQLLIDKSANVNAVDKAGQTALDAALEANESEGKFTIHCRHSSTHCIDQLFVMTLLII